MTHSLTNSCLVNLIDVTLACKDAESNLAEVFAVADVDDEDRVGNRLLQIWLCLSFTDSLTLIEKT